jgi:hypothetical protein
MRALAAVFAREIFARRLVFPVALAAGLMPILVSLANGWSKPNAAELRLLGALVVAATFSFAFALLIGGSVIAGETSEKRISFFFSRPLPAGAIWGGKLLSALFLTIVPGALALAPALLTGPAKTVRNVFGAGVEPWSFALAAVCCVLSIILGAHAVVTIARLRSPWVALDLFLAPALVLLAAAFLFYLVRDAYFTAFHSGTSDLLAPFFTGLAAALLAALTAASYAQVAAGRTDARRAHGAFSVVLWGILGTVTAALGGYAWWAASARATDLASIEGGVIAAPQGSWVAAGGPLRAGRGWGLFLFDTGGGRSIRIRSGDAAFSANGARAVWTERGFGLVERGRTPHVFVADLASAKAVETGLACTSWCRAALSPSGNRLAVLDGNTLAAYEISDPANPKQLAAIRLQAASRPIAFVGEDVLRLFPRFFNTNRKDIAPRELEIEEISLLSKKSLATGSIERDALPYLRISADGRYLVGTRDKRLTLHDGRTGALLATLSEELETPKMRFLSGGRLVVAGIAEASARLRFFESEKAPARTIDLGPARTVVLGGEIAPGRVAVALSPFKNSDRWSRSSGRLVFVDMASGTIVPSTNGLVPAGRFSWWFSPALPPAEAGLASSTLFLDANGRLVRLDPATGAQTVLLGRSK